VTPLRLGRRARQKRDYSVRAALGSDRLGCCRRRSPERCRGILEFAWKAARGRLCERPLSQVPDDSLAPASRAARRPRPPSRSPQCPLPFRLALMARLAKHLHVGQALGSQRRVVLVVQFEESLATAALTSVAGRSQCSRAQLAITLRLLVTLVNTSRSRTRKLSLLIEKLVCVPWNAPALAPPRPARLLAPLDGSDPGWVDRRPACRETRRYRLAEAREFIGLAVATTKTLESLPYNPLPRQAPRNFLLLRQGEQDRRTLGGR
jgi:hypothetical protein